MDERIEREVKKRIMVRSRDRVQRRRTERCTSGEVERPRNRGIDGLDASNRTQRRKRIKY